MEVSSAYFALSSEPLMSMPEFSLDESGLQDILATADQSLFELPAFDLSANAPISSGPSPREESTSGSDHEGPYHSRLKASAASLTSITEEEREMLAEEGVVIPAGTITLTKAEEKALKLVRRKLKNKLSAQDSRKKKKEYLDGLEKRVESCTAINIDMQQKVAALSNENRSLRQQLLQLQQLVSKMTGSASVATTGTVLMVLALSFSMFVNPSSSASSASNFSAAPRTLKGIDQPVMDATASGSSTQSAALRDLLSSWLGFHIPKDEDLPPPAIITSAKSTVIVGASSDSEL